MKVSHTTANLSSFYYLCIYLIDDIIVACLENILSFKNL